MVLSTKEFSTFLPMAKTRCCDRLTGNICTNRWSSRLFKNQTFSKPAFTLLSVPHHCYLSLSISLAEGSRTGHTEHSRKTGLPYPLTAHSQNSDLHHGWKIAEFKARMCFEIVLLRTESNTNHLKQYWVSDEVAMTRDWEHAVAEKTMRFVSELRKPWPASEPLSTGKSMCAWEGGW